MSLRADTREMYCAAKGASTRIPQLMFFRQSPESYNYAEIVWGYAFPARPCPRRIGTRVV